MRTRTGGRIVVDALQAHGCERIFTVPGESFLGLLDALYDVRETIDVITCRHEGGAGFMAEASAKLTGRPGVCVVSRGPGACNAAIAVHTARQDSTPMLLLVGQVSRPSRGREAFQEVDHARFFAPLAKHVEEVSRAEDLPAAIARAFFTAEQGRPGPVVLALPEDLLREEAAIADVDTLPVDLPEPDPGLMERLHAMLGDADRPLVITGGGGWTERARADLARFADANGLAVACTFRRNDIVDNDHPSFVGALGIAPDPLLVNRIRAADLVIAIGTRLGEVPTQGYTLFGTPGPTLVHVYPDGREIGRVFPAELAIEAAAAPFMACLARLAPIGGSRWHDWTAAARADYLADRKPLTGSEPRAGSMRMPALRLTRGVRHSTPLMPGFAPRVISKAPSSPLLPSALARCKVNGGARSKRQPLSICPLMRSRANQPAPEKSSQASRCRLRRLPSVSSRPRVRCSMSRLSPSFIA